MPIGTGLIGGRHETTQPLHATSLASSRGPGRIGAHTWWCNETIAAETPPQTSCLLRATAWTVASWDAPATRPPTPRTSTVLAARGVLFKNTYCNSPPMLSVPVQHVERKNIPTKSKDGTTTRASNRVRRPLAHVSRTRATACTRSARPTTFPGATPSARAYGPGPGRQTSDCPRRTAPAADVKSRELERWPRQRLGESRRHPSMDERERFRREAPFCCIAG